jgi:hypothetical protein
MSLLVTDCLIDFRHLTDLKMILFDTVTDILTLD